MCGRYTLASPNPAMLRERFALGDDVPIRTRYNVAPGDEVLAVTTTKEGAPRGELLRWGLVPHWATDEKTGYKMINARAETIAEKPAFASALSTRRCLILADGFYEWQPQPGGPKQPWWITRADGEPFAFAGLWAVWHGPAEHVVRSCTIVTTEANRRLSTLHDRMPVILRPGTEDDWLAHATSADAARTMLTALRDDEVAAREVGPAVSDARHDEPDCLDPPPEPDPTLF